MIAKDGSITVFVQGYTKSYLLEEPSDHNCDCDHEQPFVFELNVQNPRLNTHNHVNAKGGSITVFAQGYAESCGAYLLGEPSYHNCDCDHE